MVADQVAIAGALRRWLLRVEGEGARPLDMAALIPDPPGQRLMTVTDLREVVTKLDGQAPPTVLERRANQAAFARE